MRTPQAIDFWLPVAVLFTFNLILGIWCQFKKDNSYVDVAWGLMHIWPGIAILALRLFSEDHEDPDLRCYLTLLFISFWGVRLAIHIGKRHKNEDFRYQDMRKRWNEAGGHCGYLWRTFLYIFGM